MATGAVLDQVLLIRMTIKGSGPGALAVLYTTAAAGRLQWLLASATLQPSLVRGQLIEHCSGFLQSHHSWGTMELGDHPGVLESIDGFQLKKASSS